MANFHVGQRVVCIASKWGPVIGEANPDSGIIYPIKDQIYTVRERAFTPAGVALRLSEIINKPMQFMDGLWEATFMSDGFRPLIERKTDISIFRALLTPNKVLERT